MNIVIDSSTAATAEQQMMSVTPSLGSTFSLNEAMDVDENAKVNVAWIDGENFVPSLFLLFF